MDYADYDDTDSDTNSTTSIMSSNSNLEDSFLNALKDYKKEIQSRLIPNDEDGLSQTDIPLYEYEKELKNDADSLVNGSTDTISPEAEKYLMPFFRQDNTYSYYAYLLSVLTLNLISYPFSLSSTHSNELKNNGQ